MSGNPFLDMVGKNPLGFVGACMVWIPIAVWIIAVLHWMIGGELDAITGCLSLGVAMCLGYFTSNPPQPWIGHLFFFTTLGTVCVFPFIRAGFHARHMAAIDVDLMREAYELLRMKRQNAGIVLKMSRILADKGQYGQAIPVAEQALQALPAAHFHLEIAEVRGWHGLVNPHHQYKLYCRKCDTMSPAGTLFCPKCDHELLMDLVTVNVVPAGKSRKLLLAWLILASLIIIVPLASTLLPIGPAIIIICAVLGLGGVVGVKALFNGEDD